MFSFQENNAHAHWFIIMTIWDRFLFPFKCIEFRCIYRFRWQWQQSLYLLEIYFLCSTTYRQIKKNFMSLSSLNNVQNCGGWGWLDAYRTNVIRFNFNEKMTHESRQCDKAKKNYSDHSMYPQPIRIDPTVWHKIIPKTMIWSIRIWNQL